MASNVSKEGKTASVSARIPVEVAHKLHAESEARERSVSWMVSKILQQWAENKK